MSEKPPSGLAGEAELELVEEGEVSEDLREVGTHEGPANNCVE